MQRTKIIIPGLLIVMMAAACGSGVNDAPKNALAAAGARPVTATDNPTRAVGQSIYVPVYSHIYHQDGREFLLAVTLSIRNADPREPIVLSAVKYYDTAGHLVRNELAHPVWLPPLATLEYVVNERDATGGSGANYWVEWYAGRPVVDPIVEAVMIGSSGQQGISFLSTGRVVDNQPPRPTGEQP